MKVVELHWAAKTSTLVFPILKQGRVIAATAYSKYEGQWDGRFPMAYAVVTDDTIIEKCRIRRGEEHPQGVLRTADIKVTIFTKPQTAEKVAYEWAKRAL